MGDILVVNGEVIWDSGDLVFVTGQEEIKQRAYLRSLCDLGESEFYPEYGSELFKYLGKNNPAYIEAAAREAMQKAKGISEVTEIDCSIDDEDRAAVDAEFI